jgi:type IV pilus assembly protein PilW
MRHSSGFGLVELMVSVVVALVSMISIYQIFGVNEAYRRSSMGGSGAQINGGIAVMQIQKDAERSGLGIGDAAALNCNVVSRVLANFPLVPVLIQSAGTSDSLTFLYGSSIVGGGQVAQLSDIEHINTDTQFANVLGGQSIAPNDLVLAWQTGIANCPLFQVTCTNTVACAAGGTPPSTDGFVLGHAANTWNSNTVNAPFPSSLSKTTRLYNFGNLSRRTYCVYLSGNSNTCAGSATQVNGSLISQDALSNAAADGAWQVVTENVIQMKAEYGLDTNADGDNIINNVDTWQKAAPAQWQQVLAVRYAVLVRASNPQKTNRAGSCDSDTTTNYIAATPNADTFTNTAAAYYLGWSGADPFTTPTNADWKCYRYSVHEAVVPLRNQILLNQPNSGI